MRTILGLLGMVASGILSCVFVCMSYVYDSFSCFIVAMASFMFLLASLCYGIEGSKLNKLFTPKDEEDEL